MSNEHVQLRELIQAYGAHPVFVTGAGISVASGIAPFRGTEDAVWEKDVMEKGTNRYFLRFPHLSWAWYLERFDKCRTAKPNPAHTAIVDIEKWMEANGSGFDLITQNIDGLHIEAGSEQVIECHGAARYMRCTNRHCKFGPPRGLIEWSEGAVAGVRANPCRQTVPRCPSCAKFLRPHVLWFDECYSDHETYGSKQFDRIMDAMTVLVFVGTSFSVSITDMLMMGAYQRAVPMFTIDPRSEVLPEMGHIQAKAEIYLPELVTSLGR